MSASNSAVGERKRLGASLAQLDPIGEAGSRDARASGREHLGALVDADDRARRHGARERDRHGGRPARDVEHARRAVGDARDEERAPARVLAEREEPRVAVVRRAERREELACVPRPGRGFGHEPVHA